MEKTNKSPSVIDVLLTCKKAQEFQTNSAFADAIGVSRQKLSQWLNDVQKPSVDVLKLMCLIHAPVAPWKARLAVDLLKALKKDAEIPCTCHNTETGVILNPYCPKHLERELLITQ